MKTSEHDKMTLSKRGKYLWASINVTLMHNHPLRKREGSDNTKWLFIYSCKDRKVPVMNTCLFNSLIELSQWVLGLNCISKTCESRIV